MHLLLPVVPAVGQQSSRCLTCSAVPRQLELEACKLPMPATFMGMVQAQPAQRPCILKAGVV